MGDLETRLKYKKGDDDDWTKIEDKALRKKIQNRLAKRKSRIDARKSKSKIHASSSPACEDGLSSTDSANSPPETVDVTLETMFKNALQMSKTASSAEDFDAKLRSYLSLPGLTEHQFLPLMQYSLLRAFIANARTLGLDLFLFADDDSLSPWTPENPYLPAIGTPHTLNPTAIQLGTPHHPYLDILAPPGLRNSVLLANMTDEEEDVFCMQMHTDSFTVWGSQPWNAMAWEVSQAFVNAYSWLLDEDTIRNSNFWRAERGEDPLAIPYWHNQSLEEIL